MQTILRRNRSFTVPMVIRQAAIEDVSFILNSWLKSFRAGSFWTKQIPSTLYYTRHVEILKAKISKGSGLIACAEEDEDLIFGWIVSSEEPRSGAFVLDYVYVKQPYRRLGICHELYRQAFGSNRRTDTAYASHLTKTFQTTGMMEKKKLIFNPYLLFNY